LADPSSRDKVHFYSATEYQTENKSFTVNTAQPQFYSELEASFPTDYLRHKYFVRGDWQISQVAGPLRPLRARTGSTSTAKGAAGSNASFNQRLRGVAPYHYVTGHTWVISNRA
jgi:hypothetical protein